jgi:hypothetical protein
VGLRLSAVGNRASLSAVGAVAPRGRDNRVVYSRAGLQEWYANGPLGLEQGFTLARAPAGHPGGALTLSMTLSGNAHASLASGAQSITLSHAGARTLRYGDLRATDATGRVLPSWLQLRAGRLLVLVDTSRARYPLRIDPLFQQGEKLTGSEEVGGGRFGFSTALSSDGNTALIGALKDNSEVGAAWVFVRSGSTWTQQGPKLTGSGEVGAGQFGESVALSADGNTALIGGSGSTPSVGAAWVFTRSGSTWTQQGKKLTGGGEVGTGQFGESVALSADGNTALIGGPGRFETSSAVGAAWVFTRSGARWTQQGEKLTGTGESGEGQFGASVALSANGNTALIGARLDNNLAGAAWVFTRSGSTWTQQGEKLTGTGEIGQGELGESVALSADGNTALIGGPGQNGSIGAAWVFARSGSTWTQQGEKLTGGGEVGAGDFGDSVALASDGNSALIGGTADNGDVGAAWVFARSGSTWTQQGEKLTGIGESGMGFFGFVAFSSDGSTALIGGPGDRAFIGAAWVFASPAPSVTKVEPNHGPPAGGTSVTITGARFTGATAVKFGSNNATSFTVNSDGSITAISPAGTGTVDVTVTGPGATGTSGTSPADQFTYGESPTVTKVEPNHGSPSGGTTVTITGTGFTGATAVKFGSTSANSFTVNSATSITAVSPTVKGTGTVDVTVTTPAGTSPTSAADQFTFSRK